MACRGHCAVLKALTLLSAIVLVKSLTVVSTRSNSGDAVTSIRNINLPQISICNTAYCLYHSSCHVVKSAAIEFVEGPYPVDLNTVWESLLAQIHLIDLTIQWIEIN
ncbi:TPA: hypothetical protein ACH3X2_008644 [Trebouxia sp. C0005]